MRTLQEVKAEIINTIDGLKEVLERLDDQEYGIDKSSGHVGMTSKYLEKVAFENQLMTYQTVLELLRNVKRVK